MVAWISVSPTLMYVQITWASSKNVHQQWVDLKSLDLAFLVSSHTMLMLLFLPKTYFA